MKEVLDNIGFDWQVAVANLVNFLIIFWILKKWVFGPVGDVLNKRQETIKQGLSRAKDAEEQFAQAQTDAESAIKQAKAEANTLVAKAQATADGIVNTAAEKAETKAQSILDEAHRKIEKERKDMEQDLSAKTASLVAFGVQKILEEDFSTEQNERVTERAIDMMKNQ